MDTENKPLVSVLMTAYNREKYIAEAIESVLASTYSNFELIIVDDCSADGTVEIAKSYAKIDNRIRLHINEKNLGDYPNRNKAASYAKGKYLKYLDSDDMLLKEGLFEMVKTMETFPQAGMAMLWVYDNSIKDPILYQPANALLEYFANNVWLLVGPTGCIYSRKVFEYLGGFSNTKYVGDFEYNLKCASRFPIIKIKNGLIKYREHEGQQGKETGHTRTYRIWQYKIEKAILLDDKCPLSQKDKKQAIKKINKLQARRTVFHFMRSLKIKECYNMVFKSDLGLGGFLTGICTFK
ncbi:MAG: glycosyltransferase family 2 protein [Bacteroidetes bacterium]|nr:glycosyltransferase family 2 protein [Bacteroidota bacterium]